MRMEKRRCKKEERERDDRKGEKGDVTKKVGKEENKIKLKGKRNWREKKRKRD